MKKEQTITNWEKVYNPRQVEEKWYKFWEEGNFFRADEFSTRPPFSIVIPPPNVTGSLHMGHALNNTLQDILARYKRMDGFTVLCVAIPAWSVPGSQRTVNPSMRLYRARIS